MNNDPRTKAFCWLVAHLQAAPELKKYPVTTWLTWKENGPRSNVELPTPTKGFAVRLTPFLEPEQIEGQGSTFGKVAYRSPVLVRIEVRSSGSASDPQTEFWGSLERALRDTPQLRPKFQAAGISWWEWVQPAFSPGDNSVSTGQLRLVVFTER